MQAAAGLVGGECGLSVTRAKAAQPWRVEVLTFPYERLQEL